MGSIVVDVGGTNLRLGYYDQQGLRDVRRFPVENFLSNPGISSSELYQRFMVQLETALKHYFSTYPNAPLGVSFPGPIDSKGKVVQAPTLWGDLLKNVDLTHDLRQKFDCRVWILNDISAAVWRYAEPPIQDFCLITISSGVGNKVFRQGEILLNEQGMGGEIGHCQVAHGEFALPCDCGGKGHLGGLASGRGTMQLSYLLSEKHKAEFGQSPLSDLPAGPLEKWTTKCFVSALHDNDPFCYMVLTAAQEYLVSAMSHLYHWIGIRKFIFVGGFAVAIGEAYIDNLNRILKENRWLGMSEDDMGSMCALGVLDDDHSLIGMGKYVLIKEEA